MSEQQGVGQASALLRFAERLEDPTIRRDLAKLCADKEAVVALIALAAKMASYAED